MGTASLVVRGPEPHPARKSRGRLQPSFILKVNSEADASPAIDRIVIRFERTGPRSADIKIIQVSGHISIEHICDVGKPEVDPPLVAVVSVKFPRVLPGVCVGGIDGGVSRKTSINGIDGSKIS